MVGVVADADADTGAVVFVFTALPLASSGRKLQSPKKITASDWDAICILPTSLATALPFTPKRPPHERFLAGWGPPFMRLESPTTSRRFAISARDVCLVGEDPTCSVPTS